MKDLISDHIFLVQLKRQYQQGFPSLRRAQ